jgi:hypothetical protein
MVLMERLSNRGIRLIGDYSGSGIKTEYECNNGHIWLGNTNNILAGDGCPVCAGNARLSKEIINDRLSDRGIHIIGEYVTNKIKTEFECDNGHKWSARPDNVLAGYGCPECGRKSLALSKDIVNQRLADNGSKIRQIGEYNNSYSRTEFECGNGHKWLTQPHSVLNGKGCPICPGKQGYRPGKSGYIYILDFGHFIKYGITNNLDNRLKRHALQGQYKVVMSKLYEDGNIAQNWERSIKIIFGGRFVSKEIMPCGWTETLSPDKLEALLDTII